MKTKLLISALVVAFGLSGAALANPGGEPATPATPQDANCFGEARGDYANTHPGGQGVTDSTGAIVSERAKAGTNKDINANFKTGCGGDPTPPNPPG